MSHSKAMLSFQNVVAGMLNALHEGEEGNFQGSAIACHLSIGAAAKLVESITLDLVTMVNDLRAENATLTGKVYDRVVIADNLSEQINVHLDRIADLERERELSSQLHNQKDENIQNLVQRIRDLERQVEANASAIQDAREQLSFEQEKLAAEQRTVKQLTVDYEDANKRVNEWKAVADSNARFYTYMFIWAMTTEAGSKMLYEMLGSSIDFNKYKATLTALKTKSPDAPELLENYFGLPEDIVSVLVNDMLESDRMSIIIPARKPYKRTK